MGDCCLRLRRSKGGSSVATAMHGTQNCIASDAKQTNRSSNMGDPLSLWSLATGGGSSKSDVWKHFTKMTKKKVATRNVCSREFAYHGGTSNLRDYLQHSHPDIYKNLGEKQQTLTVIMRKCSEAKTKAIDELLVDVVTRDIRPLAIAEGEGKRRLINYK